MCHARYVTSLFPFIILRTFYFFILNTTYLTVARRSLERPCMDHMQFLMVRAHDAEETISGHAMMATAPPDSHIANHPEEKYPHQMPDVAMPDLMKLLDLSARLPLDGEITPIMAWVMVLKDESFETLTKEEFGAIKGELLAKVRCYG